MHPAIARVVSHTFYKDTLDSAPICKERVWGSSVVWSEDPRRYPGVPVVWLEPWDRGRLIIGMRHNHVPARLSAK